MLNHFVSELRRRGVIQTITAYAVGAWLIIEVFDVAGPMFAVPTWVNSLVGICFLAGFPVAAYLSWFFSFSDGALHRTRDVDGGMPLPLTVWHWAGLTVVSIAAATMGVFLYEGVSDRLRNSGEVIEVASVDESIAIVPFEDMSPGGGQAYLAEGVAAEIASLLGRTAGVRTAATSATFRLAETGVSPLEIGRELSTQSVLSGSVNAAGNRLRIRAELSRTDDGTVIWSDTFTRTLEDVFALEEEIARSITNILVDRYVEAEEVARQPRTESSDAYVLYLKGRAELRNRTTESVKAARRFFERSVALDPEYAPAMVGIAETMWQLADGDQNLGKLDPQVAASVARQNIERALLLDDGLPEAYASLGRIEALLKKHEIALAHYNKAIALNPSLVDVHIWRHLTLNELHRYADAMSALERAAELDPTAPAILHNLGFERSKRGDFEAARDYFERLIELEPDNPLGHRGLAAAAFREGELALSLRKWRDAIELSPDTPLYQRSYRGVLFGLRMLEEFRPLAMADGDELNVLLLEGNFDALHERMDFEIAADPEDPWLKFEAGWYHYLDGNPVEGDRLALQADARFTDADRFAMPMCSPAIETVPALRRNGQEDKAERYLQRCETLLARARQNVFEDNFLDHLAARIAALRGEISAATELMATAFEHGWREWWTALDPLLAPVSDEPAMRSLFVKIERDLEKQRDQARAEFVARTP